MYNIIIGITISCWTSHPYNSVHAILFTEGMQPKLIYYFRCYLALWLKKHSQYSININTEQSYSCIAHTDTKKEFPKMHHYVKFLHIGSNITSIKLVPLFFALLIYIATSSLIKTSGHIMLAVHMCSNWYLIHLCNEELNAMKFRLIGFVSLLNK